jgi:hypothetical protein
VGEFPTAIKEPYIKKEQRQPSTRGRHTYKAKQRKGKRKLQERHRKRKKA